MESEKDPPPPYPFPMIPDISYINDYLPWSIVNLFFGWGVFGIIPLIFSIICRNKKNINDLNGADNMSTLALIFNIFITIGGIIGWTIMILYLPVYIVSLKI